MQAQQTQKEQRTRRDNGSPTNSLVFTRFMRLAALYGETLQELKEKYPHGTVEIRRCGITMFLGFYTDDSELYDRLPPHDSGSCQYMVLGLYMSTSHLFHTVEAVHVTIQTSVFEIVKFKFF